MKHSELVSKLFKNPNTILLEMSDSKCNVNHILIGVLGEIIELAIAIDSGDNLNVIEELGDLEFYLAAGRQHVGADERVPTVYTTPPESLDPMMLFKELDRFITNCKGYTIYDNPMSHESFLASLGYIEGLLDYIYHVEDIKRDVVINHNTSKLMKRYSSGGYSNDEAVQREDKK